MNSIETEEYDSSEDPYEECSYCGRSVFPGAAQCPHCKNFTDGQGPLAFMKAKQDAHPRLHAAFVIGGWLLLIALLVPMIYQIWIALRK